MTSQHSGQDILAWSILGNAQRLDGGAMFGNAPKALWSRWMSPDDQNRIDLACRALRIREPSGRYILFETGIGLCFPPKLRSRYGVFEDSHRLLESLAEVGVNPSEVDVVVLSHLHFDHAGGLLTPWAEDEEPALCFDAAHFVVGGDAWRRACRPHARDRASFLPGLQPLLEATGRLEIVEGDRSEILGDDYRLHFSEGHTPGLMLAEINGSEGPVVFCGDLIPGAPWVHLPITMGYDRFPERLIEEKEALLSDLIAREGRLFFTHDPATAMARLARDDRGRFTVSDGRAALVAEAL